MSFLELTIDATRYAIPIERVEEVVARVWTTPLAGSPEDIEGIFAYRGSLAVAVDLRRRLGHLGKPRALDDHLVVLRAGGDAATPRLALAVDRVPGLREIDLARVQPTAAPHARLAGALVLEDGLVLLLDVDAVLSPEERARIDDALARDVDHS